MKDETKQARWRKRKVAQTERFDIYLPREAAQELRKRARAQGKRPSNLAAEALAQLMLGNS